jgi:NACalpha-BTF3-like transcription factor
MKITLEMIDELRSRVNVSYEEAKGALENSEGDIVQAIIFLERQKKGHKQKSKQSKSKNEGSANKALNSFLSTDFVLKRKDKVYLNIPLWIVLIVGAFTVPFSIILLVLLVLLGYQMRIVTGKKTKFDISKNVDKVTKKFKETTDKIFEEIEEEQKETTRNRNDDEEDNDEDEIIIQ